MNGFVALPPLNPAEIPPAADVETLIGGGTFWPDIDLVDLREVMRLDTEISAARLRDAAMSAIRSVRRELAAWKATQVAAGCDQLAEVPGSDVLEEESGFVFSYRRAVYSSTAAELMERLRDLGTTSAGHDRDDELADAAGEHRRAERYAIRDILGATRTTAELV